MIAVGVRYQVASANRSARACSTPEVSAPASGWPPMKRGSSTSLDDRALDRADVGDDALRRPPRRAPSRTVAASACTGAATNDEVRLRDRASTVSNASATAPRAIAVSRAAADGS